MSVVKIMIAHANDALVQVSEPSLPLSLVVFVVRWNNYYYFFFLGVGMWRYMDTRRGPQPQPPQ